MTYNFFGGNFRECILLMRRHAQSRWIHSVSTVDLMDTSPAFGAGCNAYLKRTLQVLRQILRGRRWSVGNAFSGSPHCHSYPRNPMMSLQQTMTIMQLCLELRIQALFRYTQEHPTPGQNSLTSTSLMLPTSAMTQARSRTLLKTASTCPQTRLR
uniref:Uncharacterized protein n=1 Tax=Zea mays TaxID=4577 RepID=C0HF59_MAIZE|nr:unknown [Zea mays]